MTRETASEQGHPLGLEPVPAEAEAGEGGVASQGGEEGREVGGAEGGVGEIQHRDARGALEQLQHLLVALCMEKVRDEFATKKFEF